MAHAHFPIRFVIEKAIKVRDFWATVRDDPRLESIAEQRTAAHDTSEAAQRILLLAVGAGAHGVEWIALTEADYLLLHSDDA